MGKMSSGTFPFGHKVISEYICHTTVCSDCHIGSMHETPLRVGNSLLLVGLDESRGVVETFGFPQSVLTESPQQPYSVIIAPR